MAAVCDATFRKLEDAGLEYERITSTKLSDDRKMSVLLRCISGPLKQYTNLAVVEGASYLNLVAMVKRWESSQTKWAAPINNMYQLGSASSGHDTSGPMEVDMVQDKGGKKGKRKGKFTKGKGFGSDKGKGGKDKTKFDGKGNYSNANANSVSSDACLYCRKRGRWKRDCHQRQRDQANKVQCVADAAQAPVASVSQHVTPSATNIPRPPASSAASTASSTLASATAQSSVRIYELEDNPEIDISYTRMVQFFGHGNSCEFFDISCEDDVYHGGDPALQDYAATASERLHWCQEESWWFSEDAIGQLCMVSSEGKAAFDTDIIIDSGADVSVLPLSMSACGSDGCASLSAESVMCICQDSMVMRFFGKSLWWLQRRSRCFQQEAYACRVANRRP